MKYGRKRILLYLIILHLLAVFCMRMNQKATTELEQIRNLILVMLRNLIYFGLLLAWMFSLYYRLIPSPVRRYLMSIAVLMLYWNFLKTIKYGFVMDLTLKRLIWYQYYLPLLFLSFYGLLVALALGKQEAYTIPRWAKGLRLITVVLFLLVLTNDWHQWVFRFPEDAAVFTDSEYTHQIGYFVIVAYSGILLAMTLGILIYKFRKPKHHWNYLIPMMPVLCSVGIGIVYVTGHPVNKLFGTDITIIYCLFLVMLIESLLYLGMIPGNSAYEQLLVHAEFPVCVLGQDRQLYKASASGELLAERLEAAEGDFDRFLEEGVRVNSAPISGGTVFWEEDISTVQSSIHELRDLQDSLEESHTIAVEELRTSEEKIRLEEANRLYHRMQTQTEECLKAIELRLQEFETVQNPEKERKILAEIAVYGAYFKRRNNLFFVSETQKKIRSAELSYCFKESFAALEFLGIQGTYDVDDRREFSLDEIIALQDHFQLVLEQALWSLESLIVLVRQQEENCVMYLNLTLREEKDLAVPDMVTEKEGEQEYLMTYCWRKEEQDGTVC